MIEAIVSICSLLVPILQLIIQMYQNAKPTKETIDIDLTFKNKDVRGEAVVMQQLSDRLQRRRAEQLARHERADS